MILGPTTDLRKIPIILYVLESVAQLVEWGASESLQATNFVVSNFPQLLKINLFLFKLQYSTGN